MVREAGGRGEGEGVLAIRFDVDSIRCIEDGIPRLRRLANSHDVRFTFFVNMGRSFNWWLTGRHVLRRLTGGGSPRRPPSDVGSAGASAVTPLSLPATKKLGPWAVVRTMALNPMLGDRYRSTFDALHEEGHELGLHGGTDHVVWQRALDTLSDEELDALLRPALATFRDRYGDPTGFASPGFRFDHRVKTILDREGFVYASDMSGEHPFRPAGPAPDTTSAAAPEYEHYEVPVNVIGEGNVPVIEQGLARGLSDDAIVERAVGEITSRPFALMYGHPYVEGVRADLLERILEAVLPRYEVVTVAEYLSRWKAAEA